MCTCVCVNISVYMSGSPSSITENIVTIKEERELSEKLGNICDGQ